mmetsp:Transcript_5364/g.11777  ORF Transcript_5364/g.11777 Transcript_5364/m.11777 type:complete len:235 (-) Transcript_5364:497-1201(-)
MTFHASQCLVAATLDGRHKAGSHMLTLRLAAVAVQMAVQLLAAERSGHVAPLQAQCKSIRDLSWQSIPWAGEVEVAELLGELQGLRHHTLLAVVIPNLGVSGQGEVLPQGVPSESVICQNATQIWVTGEEHAIHVPNFPLKPVGGVEQRDQGGNWGQLINWHLDADAVIPSWAQKMVYHLKASCTLRIVHCSDIQKALELSVDMVTKEVYQRDQLIRSCIDCGLLVQKAALGRA